MTISLKPLIAAPLLTIVMSALACAQQPAPQATVEIQYCGMRPGKPPLKYLSFNVTLRNPGQKPQWFLFPRALYEKASPSQTQGGVDGVEVFSASPDRSVTVAQFMGNIRLQPESAGGFQALLLPPGAAVMVRDFEVHFWGDNFSSLPLQVVLADEVKLDNVPAGLWAGTNLRSRRTADVSTRHMNIVRSRFTPRRNEMPATIEKSGTVEVANAMAQTRRMAGTSK